MKSTDVVRVSPWLDGKRWVYSITFDEALIELHRFAVPILEEHGVPGHLEAVVGHLGVVRQIGNSSYNGFRHMTGEEMRDMLNRGWGVGNHSWSHMQVNADTASIELEKAKCVLEEAIGEPITVYCSPGDNTNMNDSAAERVPAARLPRRDEHHRCTQLSGRRRLDVAESNVPS